MMDATPWFEMISQFMSDTMPIFLVLFLIPIVLVVISGGARLFQNLIEVWASQDTRKKKKDEYDAYYDARLAETSDAPETNIAYYEDESISHLTNK